MLDALRDILGISSKSQSEKHYCRKCNSELDEFLIPAKRDRETGEQLYYMKLRCPEWRGGFLERLLELMDFPLGHDSYYACLYRDEYGGVKTLVDKDFNLRAF